MWAVSIPILIKSYWNRKYGSRDVTMRPNSVRSLKSIQKYMKDLILTTQNYGKPKIIFSFFWTQWLNCTTNVLAYSFFYSLQIFFSEHTHRFHINVFSILGALVLFWAFDHVNLVWVMMCEFSYSRAIYSRVERIEHRDDFEFRLNTDQST